MDYDVIIIGAGAAGLFAAANILSDRILVLEKSENAGRKIAIAGGGRCNFTNCTSREELINHYFEKRNFVKPATYDFPPKKLISYFNKNGLETFTDEKGRVFPKSMSGEDVVNLLLKLCKKNNAKIEYSAGVIGVEKNDGHFIVKTETEEYSSFFLIIATGGKSYPSLGTTGDGYRFAKMLGHRIEPPEPALTPVKTREIRGKSLAGISVRDKWVFVLRNNKKIIVCRGDVLFTHKGISGPAILDLSRVIKSGDTIEIQLTDFSNEDELLYDFNCKIDKNGRKQIANLLSIYAIPNRLSAFIMERLGLDKTIRCGDLHKRDRKRIVKNLFFRCEVEKKFGFDKAMLTKGGANVWEINSRSLESKLVKGLYFAGEVIDVDGESGGYNLQFAFSSGKLAAESINKKLNHK